MADTVLFNLLERHQRGEEAARDELLQHAMTRVRFVASRTLRDFAQLRTWFETDDVLSDALLKLRTSLFSVRPESPGAFFALAGQQVRRVLLNMAKKAKSLRTKGFGQKPPQVSDDTWDPCANTASPSENARADEIHELIEALPDNHRKLFDLLFYAGMSQDEAATALGIAVPTVKKHWHVAKLALDEKLNRDTQSK